MPIVERHFGPQPTPRNTYHYSHYKALFSEMFLISAHFEMVAALKRRLHRGVNKSFLEKVPYLVAGFLSVG